MGEGTTVGDLLDAEVLAAFDRGSWRWFWNMFALEVLHDGGSGSPMEQWGAEQWSAFRGRMMLIADGASTHLAETAAKNVGLPASSSGWASRALGTVMRNVFGEALDRIRDNSLRASEPIRAAYWDGIRGWAAQQIGPKDEASGAFKLADNPTPLDLDWSPGEVRGQREITEIALGDWVQASSQQLLLNLRDSMARGQFYTDARLGPYPIAELSTPDMKAHAEIRPADTDLDLASEAVLQRAMQEIARSLEKRGVQVAEVGDVLLHLWSRKRGADGWAHVSLDDICEQLGKKKRSDQRQGGYERRTRDAVREAVEKVARVKITVRDLAATHKMRKGARVGVDDPVLMIRNRVTVQGEPVQGELWGPLRWDSIIIQPGAFARYAIEREGAEFLVRSRRLYALDDYRHRAVKLLGQQLEALFRINAAAGPTLRLRVATLLGYADLAGESVRADDREALEAALDRLVREKVLRDWQYARGFDVDAKVRERMTARRIEEWSSAIVELEASQPVAEQYAPLARKAVAHSERARQRTDRAARKEAAQEKAPPAGIGAELRERRARLGLSVIVAGERIGISSATVSRVENGASVSAQVASKVRAWLAGSG